MSITWTSSSSNLYLTSQQNTIFETYSLCLRSWIQNRLLASGCQQDIDSAKLIVDLSCYCSLELETSKEVFFITLLEQADESLNQYLKKLLTVFQRGGVIAFFNCATTNKRAYYSPSTLFEIIDKFHKIALSADQSLEHLSTFPCYDEEGEAQLNLLVSKRDPSFSALHVPKAFKMDELLACSLSFPKMKRETIRYLSALSEKSRSSMQVYLIILKKLQNDRLGEMAKITLIKLIVLITSCKQGTIAQKYSLADMLEMLEEAYLSDYKWGTEVLLSLCRSQNLKNHSLTEVTRCLKFEVVPFVKTKN